MRLICFLIYFGFSLSSMASDCQPKSLANAYFSSDIVFMAVIKKAKKSKEIKFKITEIFKGSPKGLSFDLGNKLKGFEKGDIVIFFGNKQVTKNSFIISHCGGIRLLGKSKKYILNQDNRFTRSARVRSLALESIRFYKKISDENEFYQTPYALKNTKTNLKYLRYYRQGVIGVRSVTQETKVAHVKIILDHERKFLEVDFLTEIPRSFQRKIREYLRHSTWNSNLGNDNETYVIIESFYYPQKTVSFIDF